MRKEEEDYDSSNIVNTEKASRAAWLVKVPRYLSEIWEKRSGEVIGRLINQPGGETTLQSNLSEESTSATTSAQNTNSNASQTSGMDSAIGNGTQTKLDEPKPIGIKRKFIASIPSEHKFIINPNSIQNQTLVVLSEDKSGLEEYSEIRTGKLKVEGRVLIRADLQPPNSKDYMRMKIQQIHKVSQPKKTVQQMDRAVVKFKPVNVHQEHAAKDKAKKEGVKAVRLEKDEVVRLIFHAFEKHQFYRQTDLQKITNQPAGIVRDVLNDIGLYHDSAPHKSLWELKPEYRNYDKELSKKIESKSK